MERRFLVRSALESDVGAITDIYADAILNTTTTYELEPPSQASMMDKISALTEAGLPCFVAEDPNASKSLAVVGFAYVGPFRPRPAYRFTVEHSVYLAQSARRYGIGRLLMDAIISECERLGFHQIVAVIGDGEHNGHSIAFHESLGFRHSGRLDGSGYKFGRWLDTVFMQRALNGGRDAPPDPASLPEKRFRCDVDEEGARK